MSTGSISSNGNASFVGGGEGNIELGCAALEFVGNVVGSCIDALGTIVVVVNSVALVIIGSQIGDGNAIFTISEREESVCTTSEIGEVLGVGVAVGETTESDFFGGGLSAVDVESVGHGDTDQLGGVQLAVDDVVGLSGEVVVATQLVDVVVVSGGTADEGGLAGHEVVVGIVAGGAVARGVEFGASEGVFFEPHLVAAFGCVVPVIVGETTPVACFVGSVETMLALSSLSLTGAIFDIISEVLFVGVEAGWGGGGIGGISLQTHNAISTIINVTKIGSDCHCGIQLNTLFGSTGRVEEVSSVTEDAILISSCAYKLETIGSVARERGCASGGTSIPVLSIGTTEGLGSVGLVGSVLAVVASGSRFGVAVEVWVGGPSGVASAGRGIEYFVAAAFDASVSG